jgi:hypothetical protein
MIKGRHTELTYKVVVFNSWLHWDANVYAPYKRRRLWGLLPDVLDYRKVFNRDKGPYGKHMTPVDIQDMAERAVKEYEDHMLAWEKHERVAN